MHPLIIDILSWGWFAFIVWAAVHEWRSAHSVARRRDRDEDITEL